MRYRLLLSLISLLPTTLASAQESSSSLSDQLKETAKKSAERLPAPLLKTMQDAVETVRRTDIEKTAKQVGDKAIDAELKNWKGESVRLSDLWEQGPIVLMWYRGGWCPYCNLQLRAMQKELESIRGAGAQLVVLTPEIPAKAKETAAKNDLAFVALFDANNDVARKYGLVFKLPDPIVPLYRDRVKLAEYNGNDAMELPLSATYVVDKQGVIRYAFLDADYKKRAEPSEVVSEVEKLAGSSSGPPVVGEPAPDFELPTLDGASYRLSESLKKGPVVVEVLRGYPGYQCGICARQVASLISKSRAFAAKNANVLLVYPGPAKELASRAKEFLNGAALPKNFTMALDPDYQFTNAYHLRWDAPRETAYPSTFVVGADGIVDFAHISKSHGGRVNTREVLRAINADTN